MTEPRTTPSPSPADRLRDGAERPARVVLVVCRMILGAGVAVAMILKVYMAVLTDHACVTDTVSLGNAIRCTPTLELMAYALALSAGLDLAYRLFAGSIEQVVTPLMLGLGATFLLVIAGLGAETSKWQAALLILALSVALGGLFYLRERLARS